MKTYGGVEMWLQFVGLGTGYRYQFHALAALLPGRKLEVSMEY
jgi:hypothetical protein